MTIFEKLDPRRTRISGVGSALIDILAREDDSFLERLGAVKGGMTYVEKSFIDRTVGMMSSPPRIVPGGSACNTIVGIARLGGKACFVGKCGRDPMGRLLQSDLESQGVDSILFTSSEPTGRVLSIVTPDAQRTMFTFLGASAQTRPAEITSGCFQDAAIVHVEGYLLFNRDLIATIFKTAKQAGALISFDLASFTVVNHARDILPELIAEHVDILLANEDEALAYTGIAESRRAILALAENVEVAVLKLGAQGSLIAHQGLVLQVPPCGQGQAIDTTGAGDLWAAGFLHGLVSRMPLPQCGRLASLCGYEVCRVIGASIPDDRWKAIHGFKEKIENEKDVTQGADQGPR